MSCTEQLEQQLSFSELRAKFGSTNGTSDAAGTDNKKTEIENNANTVAAKKKIFESSQAGTSSLSSGLKPQRVAPPPPKSDKTNKEQNLTLPLSQSTSSKLENQEENQGDSVKNIVKIFDKKGPRFFGPDTPSLNWMTQKKISLGRLKEVDEADGADITEEVATDSEEESNMIGLNDCSELSDAERGGPINRISGRQSSIGKGDMMNTIMKEMRNQGLFKKLSIVGGLPTDIGRMRNSPIKSSRKGCASDPPKSMALEGMPELVKSQPEQSDNSNEQNVTLRVPHNPTAQTRQGKTKTASLASSQSSSTIDEEHCQFEMPAIPRYDTGDEKEDKRLRDLHSVALEFYQVERSYVELLHHISENYPNYLMECEKQLKTRWITQEEEEEKPQNSEQESQEDATPKPKPKQHIIKQIASHLQMILKVHKIFLEEFSAKIAKWDSQKPDMAEVFKRNADFLKICGSFLKSKHSLTAEFQQALDENRELAYATKKFEQGILNEGTDCASNCGGNAMNLRGISIVLQLDAVHQNVVRYKLLMERYRKYLPDNHSEAIQSDEVLHKLTDVSNKVNEFLVGADADKKLLDLNRKLQGVFDVFAPGRKLLHEGELLRQTRKEHQPRYLILFSDTLLICRYNALGMDSFDVNNIYKIPIEKARLHVDDHEDYEREFAVQSPKKSSAFVARTKRDRDLWVQRISEARRTAKEKKSQRKSIVRSDAVNHEEAQSKTLKKELSKASNGTIFANNLPTHQSPNLSCDDSPEVEQKPFQQIAAKDDLLDDTRGTTSNINGLNSNSSQQPSVSFRQHYDPLWIPDCKSTNCMMDGCGTRFSLFYRRHHCRQCGWLICINCVGIAPVRVKDKGWQRDKVCPECYPMIKIAFEQGYLFPPSMIFINAQQKREHSSEFYNDAEKCDENNTQPAGIDGAENVAKPKFSIDDPTIRIFFNNRYVSPSTLFTVPTNATLKKIQKNSDDLASGRVNFRNQKGVATLRWARLTKEYFLEFYQAELDEKPSESFMIYGYTVNSNETEDGGTMIEVSHRNQIQTDRKTDKIVFHVHHSRSAEKWLDALQKLLIIEESFSVEDEKDHTLDHESKE